jgi:flagellar hook protein FlgE
MIDSIFISLSGMLGHERGLTVISNNVANMNTSGFRGSTVSFADVFIGTTPNGLQSGVIHGQQGLGGGLNTARTQVDFRIGDRQSTGQELDLLLTGDGFFILQDESGELRYTRNGNFDFNADGELILKDQKLKVMTRNASGQLVPITLTDLQTNPARPTGTVTFDGILSSQDADDEHVIESLTVFDQQGTKHTLKVTFVKDTSGTPTAGSTRWTMTLLEGTEEVGSATLEFLGSRVLPGTSPLQVTLTLSGAEPLQIACNFDTVDGGPFGDNSNVTVKSQDGFAAGTIASRTFDDQGTLKIAYTNGQTVDGAQLALAQISDLSGLVQLSNSLFAYKGTQPVTIRAAGDDLQVVSQALEGSNVNLTQQFSELILMQRGYQASSQVLSTANDMLQALLDLRGRR